MKKRILVTALTCLLMLGAYYGFLTWRQTGEETGTLRVGFIFENDESTPYTANFVLARDALMKEYQDDIEILTMNNVRATETEEPLRDLVHRGCRIIFTNDYSEAFARVAAEHPEVEFCQVSSTTGTVNHTPEGGYPDNFHTFNGKIYQGRYVSGVAAGMKLRQLLDRGSIRPEQALVGFVGANPVPEVISGYTAFLLGVRSVAPEAVMKVRYTGIWCDYTAEKRCAEELINDGCLVISAHTNTIGPAVACEEASRRIFHVGYNQSMMDVAPESTLVSVRINWSPYITGAVEAVRTGKDIERCVPGTVHGNDISAGFKEGAIQLLELNQTLAAPGTQEAIDELVRGFERDGITVFEGDYIGIDPENPNDFRDLKKDPYYENRDSSAPGFHYILAGVVEVLEEEN